MRPPQQQQQQQEQRRDLSQFTLLQKQTVFQKRQGSLGNVGTRRFVFTNFQADNYGTSSVDEGNCVDN